MSGLASGFTAHTLKEQMGIMKLKQQQPSTPFVSQLTWMSILWIFLTKLNLHIVITLFHFFLHPAICQSFCRYIFPAFHRTVMFCWHKGFILLKLKILQHMFMKHTKKFTNYVTIEIEMKKRGGGELHELDWLRWSVKLKRTRCADAGRWKKRNQKGDGGNQNPAVWFCFQGPASAWM